MLVYRIKFGQLDCLKLITSAKFTNKRNLGDTSKVVERYLVTLQVGYLS